MADRRAIPSRRRALPCRRFGEFQFSHDPFSRCVSSGLGARRRALLDRPAEPGERRVQRLARVVERLGDVNWPPKRGRHEVCYFDLVEDLRPAWADRGDVLHLKASWTKGGRERDIPIRTEAQRELLREAKQLAGAGSLIPAEMPHREQLNRFKAQTAQAGIDRVHGLRHHYAQARYAELTGSKAPAAGGPTSKQLSPEQKLIDRQARLTISRELGHDREQITAIYLGR